MKLSCKVYVVIFSSLLCTEPSSEDKASHMQQWRRGVGSEITFIVAELKRCSLVAMGCLGAGTKQHRRLSPGTSVL